MGKNTTMNQPCLTMPAPLNLDHKRQSTKQIKNSKECTVTAHQTSPYCICKPSGNSYYVRTWKICCRIKSNVKKLTSVGNQQTLLTQKSCPERDELQNSDRRVFLQNNVTSKDQIYSNNLLTQNSRKALGDHCSIVAGHLRYVVLINTLTDLNEKKTTPHAIFYGTFVSHSQHHECSFYFIFH